MDTIVFSDMFSGVWLNVLKEILSEASLDVKEWDGVR